MHMHGALSRSLIFFRYATIFSTLGFLLSRAALHVGGPRAEHAIDARARDRKQGRTGILRLGENTFVMVADCELSANSDSVL